MSNTSTYGTGADGHPYHLYIRKEKLYTSSQQLVQAGMTPWEKEQHQRFINTCVHSNQIYLLYLRHERLKPAQNDRMIMARLVWQSCKLAWCKLLNWPQVATRMIRCALLENGAAQNLTALLGSPMSVGYPGIPLDICNVCFMLRLCNTSRGGMG